mmetsp:Transcript_12681/g.20713  ORF Transcript_12681/g.20713 Transcript_12681/m.20713 type:complete len:96 (+) Transcript_12681:247-534(+)
MCDAAAILPKMLWSLGLQQPPQCIFSPLSKKWLANNIATIRRTLYIYAAAADDFNLFKVQPLGYLYKDRSSGLHKRTLPLLAPTAHSLVHHQNFR